LIDGRLVITSKRIHFLSSTGGWKVLFKNVMRIQQAQGGIYLELATKSGNGHYDVPDTLITFAIIEAVTRITKRQLLAPQANAESRNIPQDVKTAVWQRDQGKCVQCGDSSYLEFDHVIPFSKGGSNTIGNIQLLFRRC